MKALQTQTEALSLCSPRPDLTCFGCCPPIRPEHYDCLDHVGSLRREFVENRRRFLDHGPVRRPVVGYHCWALGFLDKLGRRVGCLLHPRQNDGRDLRSFINYGNKCERESCVPARMFDLLPTEGKRFWLALAQGLSPFLYSSRRSNPLFHLLRWGPEVLERLRVHAESLDWTLTELIHRHAFLIDSKWLPKAHRYLFRVILDTVPLDEDPDQHLDTCAGELQSRIASLPQVRRPPRELPEWSFTHRLPLDVDFLDFMRLGLGWRKSSFELALKIKREVEDLARSAASRRRSGHPPV